MPERVNCFSLAIMQVSGAVRFHSTINEYIRIVIIIVIVIAIVIVTVTIIVIA